MRAKVMSDSYIGQAVARQEDAALLRGAAIFLDDLRDDGEMLHMAFVRSPFAHAAVVGVEAAAARALRDVALVVAPDDVAALPPLLPRIDNPGAAPVARPVLGGGRALFAGEAVAAVVARDRYAAEDAAEAVAVDYEPLPAVASIEAALAPDAPVLHDVAPGNVFFRDERRSAGWDESVYAEAAAVVERTFHLARANASPIEPRGVVAVPQRGGLTLWSSTQIPHTVQQTLCAVLAIPTDRIVVRCPAIGGGFGQKVNVFPEEIIVAWAALRLGRPVKWLEDRSENLLASSHARDALLRVRAAAAADGRLLALDAEIYCDVGAYGGYPFSHFLEALGTPTILPGPYDLQNYRYRSYAVGTNKCPQGPYRGVGVPNAVLAHERLMDILARELGVDRAAIRRRNYIRPESFPYETATGLVYDSGRYELALDQALETIGYAGFEAERERARRDGRVLGLGFGSYVEWAGTNSQVYIDRGMSEIDGYDAARIEINADGTVAFWTSCPAIGQGVDTTFSQVVADHLGVPLDAVRPQPLTTDRSPRGSGTFASRSAIGGGGALIGVAAELQKRLVALAAEALEANPIDIELRAGRLSVRGSPQRQLSFAEVAATAPPGMLDVGQVYDPPDSAYPYATHACVVEVEPATGAVRLLRYVVVEDCGVVINPLIVEGQVHGATAQGIAAALYEAMRYDADGQAVSASFMDYLVPTAQEIPRLEVRHAETPAPHLRGGFKGVGEGGAVAPPAAITNAVADALGVEINGVPISPEVVLGAVRAGAARSKDAALRGH